MQEAIPLPTNRAERTHVLRLITDPTLLRTLKKHDLERLRTAICTAVKRYKKPKKPKYGNLNRSFTDTELMVFFEKCTCRRAAYLFRLMKCFGLRAGEAVRIKICEINLRERYLLVQTEKAQQPDMLFIHDEALQVFREYFREYPEVLTGTYFAPGQREGHVSPNWLENQWRETILKCGFTIQYGESEGEKKRSLNRLTMHSFRHNFIRRCWQACRDIVKVMRLARHKRFSSTLVYLQKFQEDMDSTIIMAFQREAAHDVTNEHTPLPVQLQRII